MDVDHNGHDVASWIDSACRDLVGQVENTLDRAAKRTHEAAQEEVPVDTGTLRDSLTREGREVYSDERYAPMVALGTIYQEADPYLWQPAERIIESEVKRLESA